MTYWRREAESSVLFFLIQSLFDTHSMIFINLRKYYCSNFDKSILKIMKGLHVSRSVSHEKILSDPI